MSFSWFSDTQCRFETKILPGVPG